MAKRYAACLALVAFTALCARGAVRGEQFAHVIPRAMVAMAVFGALGYAIGVLARNAVRESVQREVRRIEEGQTREQGAEPDADAPPGPDAAEPRPAPPWPPNPADGQPPAATGRVPETQ